MLVAGINIDALQASIETRAFDGRTSNLVFDSQDRVLFGALPQGRDMDVLIRHFKQTQPPHAVSQVRDFFKGMRQNGDKVLHFKGAGYSFYMNRVPLVQNDWQLVSILPQSVLNERIDQQNAVTRTLMLRVTVITVLLLLYLLYSQRRSHRKIRSQQEEYSAIIANISGGIQKFSGVDGSFLFLSQNYLDLLGYSREEFERIYENTFANTIYEEDRDEVLLTISRQLEKSKAIDVEYRTRAKNGSLVWLYNKGTLACDERQQPYIASIVFDITHSKEMQQAQRISDERYHFILEQHEIIIFEQDLLNGDFYCSTRWMQLFGSAFNILEPDPDGSQIPVHPDDRDALRDFQDALQQTKRVAEMRLCDVDGLYRWYRIEASNIMDDSGWPIYVIGIITDIDNQKNLELTLRNQAARDSATGMYNKLATEQAIARFLDRHNLEGAGGYALFMIDFDNFKIINDRLGHAVGDQAICAMARIIRQNFRAADIVGRIGGDEFLVFCTERLSMLRIRERAAKLGGELHTEWGEGESRYVLTASMGVACAPGDGRSFAELYQHADEATYQAKHMGKNGCVFYAEMREAGALPPPAGASVVNTNIDAAPDIENGGRLRSIGPGGDAMARVSCLAPVVGELVSLMNADGHGLREPIVKKIAAAIRGSAVFIFTLQSRQHGFAATLGKRAALGGSFSGHERLTRTQAAVSPPRSRKGLPAIRLRSRCSRLTPLVSGVILTVSQMNRAFRAANSQKVWAAPCQASSGGNM